MLAFWGWGLFGCVTTRGKSCTCLKNRCLGRCCPMLKNPRFFHSSHMPPRAAICRCFNGRHAPGDGVNQSRRSRPCSAGLQASIMAAEHPIFHGVCVLCLRSLYKRKHGNHDASTLSGGRLTGVVVVSTDRLWPCEQFPKQVVINRFGSDWVQAVEDEVVRGNGDARLCDVACGGRVLDDSNLVCAPFEWKTSGRDGTTTGKVCLFTSSGREPRDATSTNCHARCGPCAIGARRVDKTLRFNGHGHDGVSLATTNTALQVLPPPPPPPPFPPPPRLTAQFRRPPPLPLRPLPCHHHIASPRSLSTYIHRYLFAAAAQ